MNPAVVAARSVVRFYQLTLASLLGGQCRFYPTCSEYAMDVLAKYGFWRGMFKAVVRVAKCHPFHPGGYDPA